MTSLTRTAGLLWLLSVALTGAAGAENPIDSSDIVVLTGTRSESTSSKPGPPTGLSHTSTPRAGAAASSTDTNLAALASTSSQTETLTYLTGTVTSSTTGTATTSGTSTNTSSTTTSSSPPQPTNTRPCNNYPALCSRRYNNITHVGAHNSPFVRSGSAAANQQYPVTDQLNDGVRFLQAQIQYPTNGTQPHFCHTSCDLLDAGPITDWLGQVKDWVASHPYDVVTVLLGNGNYSTPDKYAPYIEESGITQFAYVPKPPNPDGGKEGEDGGWPTLAQLILSGQRVILFLDYMANTTAYPYLLDEFAHIWETPFDPVDVSFPCTIQRPPDLTVADAAHRMYLMNHNLNVEVSLLGQQILVPAVSKLNETNAASGEGSLGMAAGNCAAAWGRAPNVLNVDYYNYGDFPGSVFEVAARMNNITFEKRACCGPGVSGAGRVGGDRKGVWLGVVVAAVVAWIL